MKLKPLAEWICDDCRKPIHGDSEGYVEWLENDDSKKHSFRVVHHNLHSPKNVEKVPHGAINCYKYTGNPERQDLHMKDFTGADGIVTMLSFLDKGPYHQPNYGDSWVLDIREWVELYRRFQLPYYEEARLYWERALSDGFFSSGNEIWIYLPETLKTVIERYGD